MMKNSNYIKSEALPVSKIKINKNKDSSFLQIDDQGSKKKVSIDQAFNREQEISKFYRQKNERNVLKCKFLFNKLTTLGNLEGIPQMIGAQSGQVQTKIKELQQVLFLKRSDQMKKLRKKIKTFLGQLNFQIEDSDLQKIDDEIEIILFLIDIFQQKFKEMTAERSEIDQIIDRLQNDPFPPSDHQNNTLLQREDLKNKVQSLEYEIEKLKVEEGQKNNFAITLKDINGTTNSKENNYQQLLSQKSLQIQRSARKIKDMQSELLQIREKYRVLQVHVQRAKKEETKGKERYRLMQQMKNERIKLLEQNLKIKMQL